MAVLPILRFPDQRLHTVAKPVDAFDDFVRARRLNTLAPPERVEAIERRMAGLLSGHVLQGGTVDA